jgi:thioredoxin 2
MPANNFIIQCMNCGTKNRVPQNRIKDRPLCGKCRKPLPAPKVSSNPVMVTDQTFQNEVLSFPGPVLLDCWAPWCGPCKMVAPILDQLAREYAGRAKIAKLNVDQNPMTAARYQVLSIPTLLFFKNGRLINTLPGALQKPKIERQLRAILNT